MAEPFLSEIRLMSFTFAPKGWALCNGQLLPINQNQALFALLGTTFGGDGRVNFALPDLRARVPLHVGSGHTLGERGGEFKAKKALGDGSGGHARQRRLLAIGRYVAQGGGDLIRGQERGHMTQPTAQLAVGGVQVLE